MKGYIVTLVKNEQPYIYEWIRYHINIGFDKILIYEDFGSETHREEIQEFGDMVELHQLSEIISYEDSLNVYRLVPLYNYMIDAIKNIGWCAFIDVDEYIQGNFSNIHQVIDYLNENNLYQMRMFWRIATCNGYAYKPGKTYKLQEAYTEFIEDIIDNAKAGNDNAELRYSQKSLVRMNKMVRWWNVPHQPVVEDRKTIISGKYPYIKYDYADINAEDTPFNIRLNHYMTKSYEEFISCKVGKDLHDYGKVKNSNYYSLEYFTRINNKYMNDGNFMKQINDINHIYGLE